MSIYESGLFKTAFAVNMMFCRISCIIHASYIHIIYIYMYILKVVDIFLIKLHY